MTNQPIEFWKLSGSGNDFICIDNLEGRFDGLLGETRKSAHFARTLCRRGHGVGADGVIFATGPEIKEFADIAARFFEADGSECELCGNGTGCFTHFVIAAGFIPDREVKILTPAGVVLARNIEDDYVRVCIPSPESRRTGLRINAGGRVFSCDYSVVGVPHLISYVDDIELVDVDRWGYALRHHHDFRPRGVNVNFVQVLREGEIAVRTFEFGAEAETLACGTGSSVSAIETALRFGWDGVFSAGREPVIVHVRSGDLLRVYFTLRDDGEVIDTCLETVVHMVFRGRLHRDFAAEALSSV